MNTTASAVPSISIQDMVPPSDWIETACDHLRVSGVLLLRNVFPANLLNKLHQALEPSLEQFAKSERDWSERLVSEKRAMFSVKIKDGFNDPELYANPNLFPVLTKALGKRMIMGSFGCVASLPGASAQHQHRDHLLLFGQAGIESLLPSYAITVIVPLIGVDAQNGCTEVWPGSHLLLGKNLSDDQGHKPEMNTGDCLLMDYRLLHRGGANNSSNIRPILYNVYSRPWFRDYVNFRCQSPLQITKDELMKIPVLYQPLFTHVLAPETLVTENEAP